MVCQRYPHFWHSSPGNNLRTVGGFRNEPQIKLTLVVFEVFPQRIAQGDRISSFAAVGLLPSSGGVPAYVWIMLNAVQAMRQGAKRRRSGLTQKHNRFLSQSFTDSKICGEYTKHNDRQDDQYRKIPAKTPHPVKDLNR